MGGESTTAIDVAKVFRRGGATEAVKAQMPPNRQAYRDGLALAKLGDKPFKMVVNERVPENYTAEPKHIVQGIADVAKELKALFDDHDKLSAGLTIDAETCAKA